MPENLDYVIERIADTLNATFMGSDRGSNGGTVAISFRTDRLKDRGTLDYCNGLLEGATSLHWRADRTKPMLIVFRRVTR